MTSVFTVFTLGRLRCLAALLLTAGVAVAMGCATTRRPGSIDFA